MRGALHAIETASVDENRALQLTRLRTTLQQVHARESHYRICVDKDGHLDHLTVQVELREQLAADARPALAHAVGHRIKTMIGLSATIDVLDPRAIERMTLGKAVRVIDRRK